MTDRLPPPQSAHRLQSGCLPPLAHIRSSALFSSPCFSHGFDRGFIVHYGVIFHERRNQLVIFLQQEIQTAVIQPASSRARSQELLIFRNGLELIKIESFPLRPDNHQLILGAPVATGCLCQWFGVRA